MSAKPVGGSDRSLLVETARALGGNAQRAIERSRGAMQDARTKREKVIVGANVRPHLQQQGQRGFMTLDEEIIQALDAGRWLDFVSGYNLRDDANEPAMHSLATQFHNAGRVDLLAAVDGFDDGDGFRFYEIQQFYSDTLPQLEAEPAAMLKAVRRLVDEGGPNRDGGFIALPFVKWCGRESRATAIADLLDFEAPRDGWYLRLAIEGASASDPQAALDWALGLIAGKPGPARAAALEALGSLGNTPERAARAIEALRGHLKQETDDAVLAMALYADRKSTRLNSSH